MVRYNLNIISHRMNLGDINTPLNNQIDNSFEALKSLTRKEITGIAGFECDVRLTKDNILVVVHDASTKSITKNKLKKNISDYTYAELEKIYVKDILWYYKGMILRSYLFPDSKKIRTVIKEKIKRDTIIPKAEDMLDYLISIEYKGQVIIELKEETNKCKEALIKVINKYKDRLNLSVHGYDAQKILDIKKKTKLKAGLLYGDLKKEHNPKLTSSFIKNNDFDFYSMMWAKVNNGFLTKIINENKDLYIWTIDSVMHTYLILNKLNRYYKKYHKLPRNVFLITNIPLVIKEYFEIIDEKNNFIKIVNKKYKNLYLGDEN